VEQLLGRGGFGLVYLAHDEQLNRKVAIKVPHPHLVPRHEVEWEYACRAGSEASELPGKYGWFNGNSLGRSQPVGRLKCNDLGLFDMHGNAWELYQDVFKNHPKAATGVIPEDNYNNKIVDSKDRRVLRSGSFPDQLLTTRSANRYNFRRRWG
jgi:formylglycine-generating enzyme required for sulfatase activity